MYKNNNENHPILKACETRGFGQSFALFKDTATSSWCYVDKQGKVYDYGFEEARHFSSDGYAAVKKNGLWGFINRDFECLTGFKYSRVGDFSEGLAFFQYPVDGDKPVKRGFVDKTFKIAIDLTENYKHKELQFDDIFREGLFKIWSYCHVEWIDHSGNIVARIRAYDDLRISNFYGMHADNIVNGVSKIRYSYWISPSDTMSSGFFYDVRRHLKTEAPRIVGPSGYIVDRVIISERFEKDYEDTPVRVTEYSDYGYVDNNRKCVTGYKYKKAYNFSENRAAVSENGKMWVFLDKNFNPINECQYEDVGHFSEGLAAVRINGKWGFIDKEGILQIPCVYNEAKHFAEGFCEVRIEKFWQFIDRQGTPLRREKA